MSRQVQQDEKRSIWTGLVALVAVGLLVGVIAGGATLVGTRVLGLGGDSAGAGASDGPGASLEIPDPSPTETPDGPRATLPGGTEPPESEEPEPSEEESESEEPEDEIALQAGQSQVAAGEQIDLTGVYPGGEGATLIVQRFTDGSWTQFGDDPVTATVTGETFATNIFTSLTGEARFRMVDTDTDEPSNEVRVTIG